MPKVFIPSMPTRFDSATQQRVPSLDLNPATEYGELVQMSETTRARNPTAEMIEEIRESAELLTRNDYILAVGDVVAITAAMIYSMNKFGVARILRWDKRRHQYNVMEVEL